MVEINVTYEGSLHCKAVHKPSGTEMETDAPTDNRGKGESFSPTDLLATSLGVCYLTTMGIAAEDRGIDLLIKEGYLKRLRCTARFPKVCTRILMLILNCTFRMDRIWKNIPTIIESTVM